VCVHEGEQRPGRGCPVLLLLVDADQLLAAGVLLVGHGVAVWSSELGGVSAHEAGWRAGERKRVLCVLAQVGGCDSSVSATEQRSDRTL
jgi:hypothetical protein